MLVAGVVRRPAVARVLRLVVEVRAERVGVLAVAVVDVVALRELREHRQVEPGERHVVRPAAGVLRPRVADALLVVGRDAAVGEPRQVARRVAAVDVTELDVARNRERRLVAGARGAGGARGVVADLVLGLEDPVHHVAAEEAERLPLFHARHEVAGDRLLVVQPGDFVLVVRHVELGRPLEAAAARRTHHLRPGRHLVAHVAHLTDVLGDQAVARRQRDGAVEQQVRGVLAVPVEAQAQPVVQEAHVGAQVQLVGLLPAQVAVGQLQRRDPRAVAEFCPPLNSASDEKSPSPSWLPVRP